MDEKSRLVEEELQNLRLRFELLEGDRKAYYETSQWTIRKNKEDIQSFKQKNKELRDKIAKLRRTEGEVTKRFSISELEKMDQKVCELHKRYDDMQSMVNEKEAKAQELQDQLRDLERDAELVKENEQESAHAQHIRVLENRLDKATIKYNEAQSIKKTYEAIVKKLQEDRLTFDIKLANLERALKAKRLEVAELDLMSRDANHAKDISKAEMLKFEQIINEERKQRDKELQQRRELVRQKKEQSEKAEKKQMNIKMNELDSNSGTGSDQGSSQIDEEMEKKIAIFEDAMRTIKQATGVSNINEVIQKLMAQGDTHAHLLQLQQANEARIEELKQQKAIVQAQFEELKYSGENKHSHSARLLEELEAHYNEASARAAEAKMKHERVAKVAINAKAGVQHLADKLEGIQLENAPKLEMNDENLVPILMQCFQKLEKLYDTVKVLEESTEIQGLNVAPLLPQHNCRVKLRPAEFEPVTDSENDEEEDAEYGEVPNRESLKKQTIQILNSRLKTNKQPKKKGKKRASTAKSDD